MATELIESTGVSVSGLRQSPFNLKAKENSVIPTKGLSRRKSGSESRFFDETKWTPAYAGVTFTEMSQTLT